jgi:O-antigen/teichoic acid export membrane protein
VAGEGSRKVSGSVSRRLSEVSVMEASRVHVQSSARGRVVRDLGMMGSATFLAMLVGILQVFLIPRLVDVADYGYFRLFSLYVSYAGLLHLGFADGALLAWAGRSAEEFLPELPTALRFLNGQQLVFVLVGVCLTSVIFAHTPETRFVAASVLLFSAFFNLCALLQYALQAARRFAPIAVATVAPTGMFVAGSYFWSWFRTPSFRVLVVLYCAAWTVLAAFLWLIIRPSAPEGVAGAWQIGKKYLLAGWPIVLANAAVGIVQATDRLVLGSAASIYDFAQYSLAASTMMVPVSAITAVAQVFFPHLAAIGSEEHPRTYQKVARLLVVAWSILLPYYFFVDAFVKHFLPKYVSSLPVARILLLGAIFLATIRILQVSMFNLYGRQQFFLVWSIVAVAVGFALSAIAVSIFHSLPLLAALQVFTLGGWWLFNQRSLRLFSHETWYDTRFVLFMFVWCSMSLWGGLLLATNLLARLGMYFVAIAAPLFFLCPNELKVLRQLSTEVSRFVKVSSVFVNGEFER